MTDAEKFDALPEKTRETITVARESILHARSLKQSDPYQWLCGEMRRRCDQMADDILHNNALTHEQREAIRRERIGILAALALPAEMEASQMNVLSSMKMDL